MSATDPNPSNNPSITGQEAWFNKDVRVFEDLYVYGNLYYNFEGTDSLNLDNLNVSGIATFNDVDITGTLDLTDLTLRNLFSTGIATFTNAILPEINNLQVGFLTVTDSYQFISDGNEYYRSFQYSMIHKAVELAYLLETTMFRRKYEQASFL